MMNKEIKNHYASPGLYERIVEGLEAIGRSPATTAVSAVVVAVLGANGPLEPNFLIVWHLIGFSVFTGAGISMFFSVPSLFRIYHSKPDASIVFQFPMVLAPNFTVPLFMIAHLFALVKLFAV